MVATFKGGIRINEHKSLAENEAIKVVEPHDELVFPLSQHIGAFAKAVVNIGDKVKAGQIIGEADGFVSANVISSVSGSVKAIEPRMIVNGSLITSIIIENDYKYELASGIGEHHDPNSVTCEEIIERVKRAGIVGLGGAGFPLHVKLSVKDPSTIDYVIINGAECEPYLTNDYRCLLEYPDKVIGGLKQFLKLFPNAQGIIGIEDNKPKAIKVLSEKEEEKIKVKVLKTKYPQGGERTLIYALTGRKLNSKKLPSDVGCIVVNVSSCIASYDAIVDSIPLIQKVVTITGDDITHPGNLLVRIGTNYQELVDYCGGFKCEPQKLISGGPMMGSALFNTNIPVSKVSSALVALKDDQVAKYEKTACIHCGKCIGVCPQHLIPQMMYNYALNDDIDNFIRVNGLECIGCGCCAYICPAKRNMTQEFTKIKKRIIQKRKEQKSE